MGKMVEKIIKRKKNEEIIILSEDRKATEEGYKDFLDYFKNFNFCCDGLRHGCEEIEYIDYHTPIKYSRITRSVSIGIYIVSHCPFCGKQFPKELGLEWIHLVEKEFGEEYLRPPKMYELPGEFHTDEWWKKRGL